MEKGKLHTLPVLTCHGKELGWKTKGLVSVCDENPINVLIFASIVKYVNASYGTVSYMDWLDEKMHGRKTDFKS